jgi:2-dehydro-3-deoxyphosphogluconate aldolase/(4S)-4-hydroxy-2-oxoglutarate aldolase
MSNRERVIQRIRQTGIVPVVRAPSQADAIHLVEAMRAGGIDIFEITLTVPGAIDVIEKLRARFGDEVVVGAGTVLDAETARACIAAGAEFVVSPALDEPMIDACRTLGVPVAPGALTPTEIVRAHRAGADVVKVFPCGALGGASYVRSLKAPLPDIELLPTGGVSLKTVADFIRAGAFAVGAGADLVDLSLWRAGKVDAITANCRAYLDAIRAARLPAAP